MIETQEIRMSGNKMLSTLFLLYGIPWIVAAFAGFCVFIILGFCINFKFFILSLIWIFLLVPLVVTFLYFFYGMKTLTTFNCMPHKIIFEDQDIKINISDLNKNQEIETEKNEAPLIEKSYSINPSLIKEIKTGNGYYIMNSEKKGWLWVPVDAFQSKDMIEKIIKKYKWSL